MWRRLCNVLPALAESSSVGAGAATGASAASGAPTATDAAHQLQLPSVRGLPLLGTALQLSLAGGAAHLHEYVHQHHQHLGPLYRETLGPVDAVFVADADVMRAVFSREGKHPKHVLPQAWTLYNHMYGCHRGLFFMDGEEWLYFRRIMNKLLLKSDSLEWIHESCDQVANDIVQRWESLLSRNEEPFAVIPNLETEMYRFSIDTVIAVLLGDKYAKCKITLEPDVAYLTSVVHLIFETSAKLSLMPATWAAKWNLPPWKQFVRAVDDGLNIANKITKTIMRGPKGGGLVSRMMDENISEKDIQRIVADLILAAGDTTAYSMQWALYLLAKGPLTQDHLRSMEGDATNQERWMKAVIRETLRLYPVAPFLTRFLPEDTLLAGYMLPKGTLIIMSLYTSSRDEKYFKQPNSFVPSRWLRQNTNSVSTISHASLPFAIGARSCIGRKIAVTQMQFALTKIINKFRLNLRNEKDIQMILRMVSVPSVPIQLTICNRNYANNTK